MEIFTFFTKEKKNTPGKSRSYISEQHSLISMCEIVLLCIL